MTQTRPNKAVVPINSDAYNLTPDLATMADSLNVVIRVASQSERDALTPAAYTYISRADLGGAIELWDGTAWRALTPQYSAWNSLGAWTTTNGQFIKQWTGNKNMVTMLGTLVLSTNAPFTMTTALSTIGTAVPAGLTPNPANAFGMGAYSDNTAAYKAPTINRIDTSGVLTIAAPVVNVNVVQNCQFTINVSWTL